MAEKIWIGNDHGGYELKLKIIEVLKERGYEVTNVGYDASTPKVKFPVYASKVARAVQSGDADRGILICSTGIGMSIIANKYKGIRASLCTTSHMGYMTRAHNNSNILCLGALMTGEWEAMQILDRWLTTEFEGERHAVSLGLIAEAEAAMISDEGFDIVYEEQ